jgi:ubiquinone/menaquinone biosynthesis C-methylase UbiE
MRESSVDRFGGLAENYFDSPAHRQTAKLDALVERTGVSGGTVVDVGTGAGHTAYAFAKAADKVIAVDPTPEMLAIVDRESAGRVETLQAFAEDLPLEASSVEGVATRLAAHHFESVERFLAESNRVLKPGGWIMLNDIVGPEGPFAIPLTERVGRLVSGLVL